jgi:hypothetical protein
MRNTADVIGGKPIAILLQSISGVSTKLIQFQELLKRDDIIVLDVFCL